MILQQQSALCTRAEGGYRMQTPFVPHASRTLSHGLASRDIVTMLMSDIYGTTADFRPRGPVKGNTGLKINVPS